jgi:hypothetical protein
MKGTVLARTLLCLAVLALAGGTALAQDSSTGVITINGGRTTVAMRPQSEPEAPLYIPSPGIPFYNDFTPGSSPYICSIGYTVSDGSPINVEQTPASQFMSRKTGTSSSITIAVGLSAGTNVDRVTLDKDCAGVPCGTVDKTHLCRGTIRNMPSFGTHCTTVEHLQCTANLTKGNLYWVYVESSANSASAWNLANTAVGPTGLSTDDGAWTISSGRSLGAFAVR